MCFGIVINSCKKEIVTPPYFEIEGINTYCLKFTNEGLNPWLPLKDSDTLSWNNYFARYEFDVSYVSTLKQAPNLSLKKDYPVLPGYLGSKIGVDTIYFTTIHDYNGTYLAGDTINNIVLMSDWTYTIESFSKFYTISDYIEINQDGIRDEFFESKLTEAPDHDKECVFKIAYVLKNGETFISNSGSIYLTQ